MHSYLKTACFKMVLKNKDIISRLIYNYCLHISEHWKLSTWGWLFSWGLLRVDNLMFTPYEGNNFFIKHKLSQMFKPCQYIRFSHFDPPPKATWFHNSILLTDQLWMFHFVEDNTIISNIKNTEPDITYFQHTSSCQGL